MLLACLSRLTSSTLSPLAWTPQPDGMIPWYASAIWISLGKQLWEKRKGPGGVGGGGLENPQQHNARSMYTKTINQYVFALIFNLCIILITSWLRLVLVCLDHVI